MSASPRPIHYILLLQGAFVCLLCGTATATIASFETLFTREMGLEHKNVGALIGAVFLGNLLGSILLIRFSNTFGLKTLGLITFGLIVIANMVSGVKSVPLLVLGRVLMGIGVSGTGVFALTIVVHHFAKRQAGWISVIHGLMAASGGLGLAFARPLAERFGDWAYVYWLIAALAAVPTVALLLTPCREPVGGEPFELRGVVQAARHPALWPIALVLISYIIAEGATATYFAALMEHRRKLDPVVSVRLTAVFWIGVVLGRVSILALSHVMREKTLILVGALVGGAALVLAAFAWPMAAAGVCLFVGGFLIGPVAPVAVSLAVARIGRFKPAVLAMTNLMMCVGGLIGPMAVGAIADGASLRTAIVIGSLAMPLGILPLLWRVPRDAPA